MRCWRPIDIALDKMMALTESRGKKPAGFSTRRCNVISTNGHLNNTVAPRPEHLKCKWNDTVVLYFGRSSICLMSFSDENVARTHNEYWRSFTCNRTVVCTCLLENPRTRERARSIRTRMKKKLSHFEYPDRRMQVNLSITSLHFPSLNRLIYKDRIPHERFSWQSYLSRRATKW